MEESVDPKKLAAFGRSFFLLFNRSTMYDANHPYCRQAVDEFLPTVQGILQTHSPLVFIMNQEKFFVDEEPVDPRINISKMLSHFKKAEIHSISFNEGLDRDDIMSFVEVFTSQNRYPNAEAMKAALSEKGIRSIKINHVFFKKVSTDEEIVSRDALGKASLGMDMDSAGGSKKAFLDMVLESVLMEEFEKALTIKNITEHPAEISDKMIEADIRTYRETAADDKEPGLVLAHQLQLMEQEVKKHLTILSRGVDQSHGGSGEGIGHNTLSGETETGSGEEAGSGAGNREQGGLGGGIGEGDGGGAELTELASAVFKMKRQLINGMELQKSLGIKYPNEEEIRAKADEITDNVIVQLIKKEYRSGQISTSRMAHIIKRMIPDVHELKRLMPKIKKALMEEGMALSDYLNLVQELSHELQSEELSKVLQTSAESVGLDGADLIQEIRQNPVQAAELIFLAAEIRKGSGDDQVLTDILVEYVEQIGAKLTLDMADRENVEGEQHLRKVMDSVESQMLGRLKGLDIKKDVLERMEEKLNSRIDELFEQIKTQWKGAPSAPQGQTVKTERSVLQILEQSVGENEELGDILRSIRREAEQKSLNENDFKEILKEIQVQKEDKQKEKENRLKMTGVLDYDALMFYLQKEIFRSRRYDLPFATLSFSVVSATAKEKAASGALSHQAIIDVVLKRLSTELRGADVAALVEKNKLVAFLPMTPPDESKLALKRHLKLLNTEPVIVAGIPVKVRVAGAITDFHPKRTPDAEAFFAAIDTDLSEMVNRIKNLHGLA